MPEKIVLESTERRPFRYLKLIPGAELSEPLDKHPVAARCSVEGQRFQHQ